MTEFRALCAELVDASAPLVDSIPELGERLQHV
jgi:hypothetical protein